MYCIKCGKAIQEQSSFCSYCGASQTVGECVDSTSSWIPNNTMALVSYYLGIASLLCGLLTGIPALVTGIMGIKFARQNPAAKGVVHAWVGIVLGSIALLFQLMILITILLAP